MKDNIDANPREALPGARPFDPKTGSPRLWPEETARYLRIAASTLAAWRTGRRGEMGPRFVKIVRRVF